jgi:hypothetical protein
VLGREDLTPEIVDEWLHELVETWIEENVEFKRDEQGRLLFRRKPPEDDQPEKTRPPERA